MFYLYLIGIILISFVIQSSSGLESLRIIGLKPNWLLPTLIFTGYRLGKMRGLFFGLILGAAIEISCSDHLGIITLTYGILGWLAGFASKHVQSESWISLLIGTLIASLIEGVLLNFANQHRSFWLNFWLITLPGSCYNLVPASILYLLFRKLPESAVQLKFEKYQPIEE
ncbi:MAG: rod shape-determining protein MreD [bacterium]|nr:rod shape-determining protein MreD [bacterium]